MEDLNISALDFVQFCHRRCGQEWPELYDEMCRVRDGGSTGGWVITN
ncbi:hypothetical protein [Dehalococcoides mccartyi]|nr:hypothetical protein [Dehalococcoides mccartyi]